MNVCGVQRLDPVRRLKGVRQVPISLPAWGLCGSQLSPEKKKRLAPVELPDYVLVSVIPFTESQ